MSDALTASKLRELVFYDPDTGVFLWLKSRSGTNGVGEPVGCIDKSRDTVVMTVNGVRCFAHRAAFLYMTGKWPTYEVDHINGNRLDNRWQNLRDVPRLINQQNIRKAIGKNCSERLLGTSFNKAKKKWTACIGQAGKTIHLGSFDTPEQAHERYLAKKREIHAGCTI
jgi:hypothetical protein